MAAEHMPPSVPARRPAPGQTPTLALIGCGAFAEAFYLPAMATHLPGVLRTLILVDTRLERARYLAARFGAGEVCADYHDILTRVDGAILAIPHAFHHAAAITLLLNGVHVLCEKPLTLSAQDAHDMVAAADRAGAVLAANYVQRLFPSNIKVREMLRDGELGQVEHITYDWGSEFTWPTVSGFYFGPDGCRRYGVLADRGAHALDLICWWLGAKPRITEIRTDALGGLDAVAQVRLQHEDCTIDIRLSWLSKLANRYTIRGSEAEIENNYETWDVLPVRSRSGEVRMLRFPTAKRAYRDYAADIVANFINAIQTGTTPLIPARDVLASVELIEACYAAAVPFHMPWIQVESVLDGCNQT